MMRTLTAIVLASGIAASVAVATGSVSLTPRVRDALTTIDTIPTKPQLDFVFPGDGEALSSLSTIAQDSSVDIGIRVRAIHGLGHYCPDPCSTTEVAHESLATLISDTKNETVGQPVVLLRAAIETLGTLHVDSDVTTLIPLLDHPSRDIRAATARALRDLCNTQAVTPLRVRYTSEPTDQVKLAISEALRILGQCGQ